MNEVVKVQTFEDRMKQRIRESIGELMSDEDLAKIVSAGVHEAFFKPRVEKYDAYHGDIVKPALIVEILKELLAKKVKECVQAWLDSHNADVIALLEKTISMGLVRVAIRVLEERTSSALFKFGEELKAQIQNNP